MGKIIKVSTAIVITIVLMSVSYAQETLIPKPQKVDLAKTGKLSISSSWKLLNNNSEKEGKYLLEQLKKKSLKKETSNKFNTIEFINLKPKEEFHDYYQLIIHDKGIKILSTSNRSALYGVQTFLQLVNEYKNAGSIPHMKIEDYAKFPYRGMHLDVCRHFFTIEEVKSYIDYLSWYKINKFHWHLTDDQGWRIEIKKYPKLTEIGAYRKVAPNQNYPAEKLKNGLYGGYYTQDQIRDVVQYAKKLNIDIIPEIEMPGHAQAALSAYPEYSCTGGPFEVWNVWGVSENIFCPKEETFTFLQNIIDEVITLFPYNYIHIGGDEAPKARWKDCEFCQNLIKKLGIKDEHELQSYFITRMEKYINSKGKNIIGWDEILEGGLAPNATVMSWRGEEGAIHAAKNGNDAIMTPVGAMYFDYYQGNPSSEPIAFGAELRLQDVYKFNPIPKELNSQQARHIIGTQANMWTEHIATFNHLQYMLFPRLFALSEVAWGTANKENYTNFENRVLQHLKLLNQKGINYGKAIFELNADAVSKDGNMYYELKTNQLGGSIKYTVDGSTPTKSSLNYDGPILLDKSKNLRAGFFKNDVLVGTVTKLDFFKSKSTGSTIKLVNQPSSKYADFGPRSLVNGIFGNPGYFKKNWLGFDGEDLIATIDLSQSIAFSTVQLNTMDNKGDWIHPALSVKIFVSDDDKNYALVKEISKTEIDKAQGQLTINFPKQNKRYLKIEAECVKSIPAGFTGTGNKAWLFVDEIAVY